MKDKKNTKNIMFTHRHYVVVRGSISRIKFRIKNLSIYLSIYRGVIRRIKFRIKNLSIYLSIYRGVIRRIKFKIKDKFISFIRYSC
jgi:hypothetical protein